MTAPINEEHALIFWLGKTVRIRDTNERGLVVAAALTSSADSWRVRLDGSGRTTTVEGQELELVDA